jgi:23S rRNA (uridine2552-2'-O)-methyltransferase
MDEKFGLFKMARAGAGAQGATFRVLDLGAAPGSWSLYVLRKTAALKNDAISLTAADISPLSRQYDKGLFEGPHFCFIQGDITDPATRDAILSRGPYSLIISDAAPTTTGNHSVDVARSLELAEAVLGYAQTALQNGGSLALKVFQGGDTAELLKQIKTLFAAAKSFKPQACRSESFETYYIGMGRKRDEKL